MHHDKGSYVDYCNFIYTLNMNILYTYISSLAMRQRFYSNSLLPTCNINANQAAQNGPKWPYSAQSPTPVSLVPHYQQA
jgi:hypothetical protein